VKSAQRGALQCGGGGVKGAYSGAEARRAALRSKEAARSIRGAMLLPFQREHHAVIPLRAVWLAREQCVVVEGSVHE